MGDHNYYTALSHVILAGTSIYCLNMHYTNMGTVCYGLIATNSLLGIWRWGNPDSGPKAKSIYETTAMCQEIISLGAVAAEMWTASCFFPEFWMLEILIPVIPLSLYILEKSYKEAEQITMALNGLSVVSVSVMTNNWWGIAATVSFLWGYMYAKEKGTIKDIPVTDLINYELCFFCFFTLKALGG